MPSCSETCTLNEKEAVLIPGRSGAKKSEEDEEEQEEQDMTTQYELQISLEPSMESGSKLRAAHGWSAVLSIVREMPPALKVGRV
eukprot:1154343-Pelagomonas_calceolata.AAC.3